jgi:hypothetical protein
LNWKASATFTSWSTGLKRVEPWNSDAETMTVCANTVECVAPNTSSSSGRSLVWMPTGIGKLRGSTTVSEMAPNSRNQSVVPGSGLSPFSTFWL